MAIVNFVPEVWSAQLLRHLRAALVYGQAGVINRDYEGDIAQAGDTVHITQFGDPSVSTYDKTAAITYETLSDDSRALVVDQAEYFAFAVDDIDRRQALPGFVGSVTQASAYKLAFNTDAYLSGLMQEFCASGNKLGAETITDAADAYELLVALRQKLVESNVPQMGWWCVVPPEFYSMLLKDDRFTNLAASGETGTLRNGQVGRAAGFDIYESNTTPVHTAGVHAVIAGSPMATTFAEQISSVESIRLIDNFSDGVRGLHLYGAKVVQPTALTTAIVTVS